MTAHSHSKSFINWQRFKASLLLGVAPALALPASTALAQDTAVLEEILVTATRRAETDVQRTPVAVTALGPVEIDRVIPRDLGDLLSYAPNVSNGKQPGFRSANFAIRFSNSRRAAFSRDGPVTAAAAATRPRAARPATPTAPAAG